jgi:hypothetical protein
MSPQQADGAIWAVRAKRLCTLWRATADCLDGHEGTQAAADVYRRAAADLEREAGCFLRDATAFETLRDDLCTAVRESIRMEAQRAREQRAAASARAEEILTDAAA